MQFPPALREKIELGLDKYLKTLQDQEYDYIQRFSESIDILSPALKEAAEILDLDFGDEDFDSEGDLAV